MSVTRIALDHVEVSFRELARAFGVDEIQRAWVVNGASPAFAVATGRPGDGYLTCDWANLVSRLGMQGEPWRVWVEQEQDYVHVVTRWAAPGDPPNPFKFYAEGAATESRGRHG